MSECVVSMEMPQDCGECRFRSDGWCYGIREFDPQPGPLDFEKRPSWCPIICQLPEGHGRLVDAAVLKNKNMRKPRGVSSYDYGAMATVFMDMINDTPTIVPAEDGKHE